MPTITKVSKCVKHGKTGKVHALLTVLWVSIRFLLSVFDALRNFGNATPTCSTLNFPPWHVTNGIMLVQLNDFSLLWITVHNGIAQWHSSSVYYTSVNTFWHQRTEILLHIRSCQLNPSTNLACTKATHHHNGITTIQITFFEKLSTLRRMVLLDTSAAGQKRKCKRPPPPFLEAGLTPMVAACWYRSRAVLVLLIMLHFRVRWF